MQTRALPLILATFALTAAPLPSVADPLHARLDGTFWHHDSGWLFPARIGEFTRVGAPQDVAGSPDAVAYYERYVAGARVLAVVDVFQSVSAAEDVTLEDASASLTRAAGSAARLRQDEIEIGARGFRSARLFAEPADVSVPRHALYFVDTGDWRVRIRVEIPDMAGDLSADLDTFARAQSWDKLP
jgi:hypothetical protein